MLGAKESKSQQHDIQRRNGSEGRFAISSTTLMSLLGEFGDGSIGFTSCILNLCDHLSIVLVFLGMELEGRLLKDVHALQQHILALISLETCPIAHKGTSKADKLSWRAHKLFIKDHPISQSPYCPDNCS